MANREPTEEEKREMLGQRLYCLDMALYYGNECVGLMCDKFWRCKQRQENDK